MKKKLLFVNGHLKIGGVEKSLADLLSHLDYEKYDVDLLLLEDKGDYLRQIPKDVNVLFIDTTKAYGSFLKVILKNLITFKWSVVWYRIIIFFTQKMGKFCLSAIKGIFPLRKNYDVAIAYRTTGVSADIVAYVVNAKRKIVWWHNGEVNLNFQDISSYNKTWRLFDNVISVSKVCKEMLVRTFTYPSDRIIVIPNMIDIMQISKMAGKCSPYSYAGLNIVSVGRLCVEKHFEDIVFVVKQLLKNGVCDFRWYIIGDGVLRAHLESIVDREGIGKHIIFLGKITNPYPWMKYADIYVHPSYVESQGLTILEAMALNTPCVVCRSAGPSEYVIDGVNAILTEPNPNSLYEGVVKMLKNKNQNIFVEEAQVMVKKRFSSQRVIDLFDRMINLNQTTFKDDYIYK